MKGIDEQVIFLILFVVIGAIKWVFEKIKGPQEPHDVSETLEDMYDDFREEIRQHQTQVEQQAPTPPPLPQIQEHIPSRPPASAKPENFKVNRTDLSTEEKAAIERFQNLGSSRKKRSRGTAIGSVRDMLTTPGAARRAVVLKEILDEPRSMQQI